jgi:hypothetical protein
MLGAIREEKIQACLDGTGRERALEFHREIRSVDSRTHSLLPQRPTQALPHRHRTGLRQLQFPGDRVRHHRANLRLPDLSRVLRERRLALFLLRRDPARSRQAAAGRRQTGSLHPAGKRENADEHESGSAIPGGRRTGQVSPAQFRQGLHHHQIRFPQNNVPAAATPRETAAACAFGIRGRQRENGVPRETIRRRFQPSKSARGSRRSA